MIKKYNEYIIEHKKEDIDLDLYIEIIYNQIYFKTSRMFMNENYRYNLHLLFNKLKTYFKHINLQLLKSAGEISYFVVGTQSDIRLSNIRNFIIYYYNIVNDNNTKKYYIKYKKSNDIINFIQCLFEFKLNNEMINIIDSYIENTNDFDKSLIPYIQNNKYLYLYDKYKHLIDANNFDLI